MGLYGTSGLSDATVRRRARLPARSYQALGTIEWHSPEWDVYGNAGVEYVSRHYQFNSSG